MKTLILLTLTALLLCLTPIIPALADESTTTPQTEKPAAPAPETTDLASPDPLKLSDPEYLVANFTLVGIDVMVVEDFPALFFMNATTGEMLMVILDARNGKDTWALTEDPIVLLAVPSASKVFVDSGFKSGGKATRKFEEVSTDEDFLKYFRAPEPEKTRLRI